MQQRNISNAIPYARQLFTWMQSKANTNQTTTHELLTFNILHFNSCEPFRFQFRSMRICAAIAYTVQNILSWSRLAASISCLSDVDDRTTSARWWWRCWWRMHFAHCCLRFTTTNPHQIKRHQRVNAPPNALAQAQNIINVKIIFSIIPHDTHSTCLCFVCAVCAWHTVCADAQHSTKLCASAAEHLLRGQHTSKTARLQRVQPPHRVQAIQRAACRLAQTRGVINSINALKRTITMVAKVVRARASKRQQYSYIHTHMILWMYMFNIAHSWPRFWHLPMENKIRYAVEFLCEITCEIIHVYFDKTYNFWQLSVK